MDYKKATRMLEGMPLNPDPQDLSNEASTAVDPGVSAQAIQATHVTLNHYHPPPLYYLGSIPCHPSMSGISDRGAPPSYEEAIDPNAPPPAYETLFGRMRAAHKTRQDIFDFLQNILILLLGTIGLIICFAIFIIIPICMMVIGGLYLYDCPQEEYIPIFLLVGGGFGILKQLLHLSAKIQYNREEHDDPRVRQSSTQKLLNCFLLMWIVVGSVWIYREYEPNYDPALGKYCNKTLYLFAFWSVTLVNITLILTMIFACGLALGNVMS